MTRGARAYRRLLRALLPADVAREAEPELLEMYRDLIDRAGRGRLRVAGAWARLLVDLFWSAAAERLPFRTERAGPLRGAGSSALKSVVRRPRDRAIDVLTVGLGVGVAVAVSVLARDVLLTPLPYHEADRLVRLRESDAEARLYWPSRDNFEDWRRAAGFTEGMAAATAPTTQSVLLDGRAVRADVVEFSAGFFRLLGVATAVGRLPGPEEEGPGGTPVALVSSGFHREALGGADLSAIELGVGTERLPVVGVLPPAFGFLADGAAWGQPAVWIPMERRAGPPGRMSHGIHVVARLRPGLDMATASAELDDMAAAVAAAHGEATHAESIRTTRLASDLLASARTPLRYLLGAAAAILLVAVMNLAGARLVHGLGRAREFALRRAVGASRAQLVAHLLAEAAWTALPGALVGLGLAHTALEAARRLNPSALPRLATVEVGLGTSLAAGAAAVLIALLAAAIPTAMLSSETITSQAGRGGLSVVSRPTRRAWDTVLALQVAFTVALSAGAGVMIQSLIRTLQEPIGYDPAGVMVVEASLPEVRYRDAEARSAWVDAALAAVRDVASVRGATVVDVLPHVTQARISPARAPDVSTEHWTWGGLRLVDRAYFDVLGIPQQTGGPLPRALADGLLIDRTLAESLLGDAEPVGARVRSGMTGMALPVAGVVGAVREWDLPFGAIGMMYLDYRAVPNLPADLYLLADSRPGARVTETELRAALRSVDELVPLDVRALEAHMAEALGSRRLVSWVVASFACLGLLLAGVGIHGVVAYVARRRLRESGVRIALGASPGSVRGTTLGVGLRPTVLGALGGMGLALLASRLTAGWDAEVARLEPPILAGAAALAVAAALVAAWLPVSLAGRADPVDALRAE